MARFLPLLFKIIGRFSFAKIFFLLVFFLQNIPPPGIMDCCLPCNRSAAHGAQWLDLELIFLLRLTQHRNRRARRERVADASLRPAKTFMHACTVQGPRKLNVAVFKGFYDTQTQPVSVSLKNAKSCVRSMYNVYTQTVIGIFFVHGNRDMHACLTQGWNLFYFLDAIFRRS